MPITSLACQRPPSPKLDCLGMGICRALTGRFSSVLDPLRPPLTSNVLGARNALRSRGKWGVLDRQDVGIDTLNFLFMDKSYIQLIFTSDMADCWVRHIPMLCLLWAPELHCVRSCHDIPAKAHDVAPYDCMMETCSGHSLQPSSEIFNTATSIALIRHTWIWLVGWGYGILPVSFAHWPTVDVKQEVSCCPREMQLTFKISRMSEVNPVKSPLYPSYPWKRDIGLLHGSTWSSAIS